jgi:dTDP-glucose 4,6-dehydratase
MRVLLTGASGFLGAHVLKYLLRETDWEIVCPVTFKHKGVPERITWASSWRPVIQTEDQLYPIREAFNRVKIVQCDLASPINDTTARVFGDIDAILNLASDTHPPRSVEHPVEFVQNNVNLTLYLLEYARLVKPTAFVQLSTDSVYGPAPSGTHREWDPIVPNNPYSASKACQEALVTAYWRSYHVPGVIVSTMNPMGETQDLEKFIPMTIRKIMLGETVLIHGNGTDVGCRTYIYADDVADALLYVLRELPVSRYGFGVTRPDRWNVAGTRELDNLEVARGLADALEIKLNHVLVVKDHPEHGHRYALDGSKLAAAGWRPRIDVRDSLISTAQWTAANPLWVGL